MIGFAMGLAAAQATAIASREPGSVRVVLEWKECTTSFAKQFAKRSGETTDALATAAMANCESFEEPFRESWRADMEAGLQAKGDKITPELERQMREWLENSVRETEGLIRDQAVLTIVKARSSTK